MALSGLLKACPHWQQIVAENGNKLLPNCCRFRQQFVAVSGNNLLPKIATKLYCPHWQQLVAEIGNNLLPKSATNCCQWPVWTGLNKARHGIVGIDNFNEKCYFGYSKTCSYKIPPTELVLYNIAKSV